MVYKGKEGLYMTLGQHTACKARDLETQLLRQGSDVGTRTESETAC